MLKDDPDHWTRLAPLPKPARKRKGGVSALFAPAPPPFPDDPPPPSIGPRALSLAEARRRDLWSAVIASVLFHILLLWGVGRMVPEFNPRLFPDTPSVQLTLVDPIVPIEEPDPLVLRRLETPPEETPAVTVPIPEPVEAPPVAVPLPELQRAQRIEVPKTNARPTTPRALPKLTAPTAPPAPVAAPTPAPSTPLPQIIKAPPSTLEDLDLHKTPAPTRQLMPKLTLPAPPSFGEPGGGPPGSAAPGGGGAPGVAAPGTGAKPNYDFTYGSAKGMNCSKAAMAIMSAADQEKCKVMLALQAAAALKNMKAADRNSTPLDRLGPELRTGFNAERDARAAKADRGAAALAEIGARNVGATSSAAAGVRCGVKIGPLADNEKLSCGVGFNPAK